MQLQGMFNTYWAPSWSMIEGRQTHLLHALAAMGTKSDALNWFHTPKVKFSKLSGTEYATEWLKWAWQWKIALNTYWGAGGRAWMWRYQGAQNSGATTTRLNEQNPGSIMGLRVKRNNAQNLRWTRVDPNMRESWKEQLNRETRDSLDSTANQATNYNAKILEPR